MNELEYFNTKDHVSASTLKEFAKTMLHGYKAMNKGWTPPDPKSASMYLGSAIHKAVLEPDDYKPVVYEGTITAKKNIDAKVARERGDMALTKTVATTVDDVAQICRTHPTFSELLKAGEVEKSVFATNDLGIQVKGRMDIVVPESKIICDLKTASQNNLDDLEKHVYNLKYHWQAAFYTDLMTLVSGESGWRFVFFFVSTDDPEFNRMQFIEQEYLDVARKEYRPLLLKIAECLQTGEWPGYSKRIEPLSPPAWIGADK